METICLAVDVEGGDFGASVTVRGVLDALQGSSGQFRVLLCGDSEGIERTLREQGVSADRQGGRIEVVHCPGRVPAHKVKRTSVWKEAQSASIIRCIALQKEGRADASISAGDTAILLGGALFILGRRANTLRPALAAFLPTTGKRPVLLLDVGANLKCRQEHLVSFATMGCEFVTAMSGKKTPSLALLNIGIERVKGTTVIGEADRILRRKGAGYAGFVEANQVFSGDVDVVVCDGFVGNVLLKTGEGFHALVTSVLESGSLLPEGYAQRMAHLDPEHYGAVPFLGIRGIVLKAHGRSSRRAIASALLAADTVVRRNRNHRIFA
ncbi:MAG: phosphate acyltransferase [Chitinispirillaceae bacterium]|nr:phosphate acyltransferase [Chitinispirillaceae bacterium]